jgi:gliding motility-associated-like protein
VVSPAATHCYPKAGLYSINLITTDAKGCRASLVYTNCITVLASPKADFIHTPEKVDLNIPEVEFKNTSVNATNVYWKLDTIPMGTKSKWYYKFPDDVACYNVKIFASNGSFCIDSTEQQICVTEGFNFWMPNAFTPDEDEMNEIFIPKGTYWSEDNYSFIVYDRWGTAVFKTNSIYQGWNGKAGGIKCTDEVYVWKVHILDKDGNKHDYYGKVALLR